MILNYNFKQQVPKHWEKKEWFIIKRSYYEEVSSILFLPFIFSEVVKIKFKVLDILNILVFRNIKHISKYFDDFWAGYWTIQFKCFYFFDSLRLLRIKFFINFDLSFLTYLINLQLLACNLSKTLPFSTSDITANFFLKIMEKTVEIHSSPLYYHVLLLSKQSS